MLLSLLQLAVTLACARAGGGHSYSGGHSSYSGGGSHHGGGGDLIGLWILMVVRHPFFGVPVTLGLVYLFYVCYGGFDDYRTARTIARGLEAQSDLDRRRNLAALRERDAAFDPGAFLKRVEASFLKIQEAWSAMDMSRARAFISDGVMERFTLQLAMYRAAKMRNVLVNVAVEDAEILQIDSSAHWDVLHVRVAATGIDRDVSLEDGTIVRDAPPQAFEEVWSFARRPGAKTLAGRGALEGACPNCGTPLQLVDGEQCGACKSWLNSGEFDWVLCEITQGCEWAAREPREIPGVYTLCVKDPALNSQFLEDRASVAFWRWQEALWTGKSEALRAVATDEFCGEFDRRVADFAAYRESAVGAVKLLAIESGPAFDRAHLGIRWSGDRGQGCAYHETILILARKTGVATDARAGLRSLRCAACGAPPTSRTTAKCEYCGKAFNDGSRQWVLVETMPAAEWTCPVNHEPTATTAGPPASVLPAERPEAAGYGWSASISPEAALRVMAAAMAADGEIAPEERRYLETFALRQAVPEGTTASLLDAARSGRIEVPRPQSTNEACAFLRGVVLMSLADGKLTKEERRLIGSCGEALELKPVEVDELIARERKRLYEQAKKTLASP